MAQQRQSTLIQKGSIKTHRSLVVGGKAEDLNTLFCDSSSIVNGLIPEAAKDKINQSLLTDFDLRSSISVLHGNRDSELNK